MHAFPYVLKLLLFIKINKNYFIHKNYYNDQELF